MQKNFTVYDLPAGAIEKAGSSTQMADVIWKMMKISMVQVTLAMIFTSMVIANENYAQKVLDREVNLSVKEVKLKKVLREIEAITRARFVYSRSHLKLDEEISMEASGKKLGEVLEELLAPREIQYRVQEVNDYIVLTRETQTSASIKESSGTDELVAITVTGKITDASGITIPGVSILVKGTNTGTVTDAEGSYSINVPDANAILVFSSIGYVTQEVAVNGRAVIDVTLVEDVRSLDEVVVVGYAIQKKVNLTGSVASVDSEFLEGRPLTNASQALQGVNGIYVNQVGGQPGADNATIRIRGIGTLNDNNPLVLVDGIESSLRDVNPNDIENISVLKDAASAAIYGSRAANGVILITTKTGKNENLKVELHSYYGLQQATYLPDVVSNSVDYMNAMNQAYINEGQKPFYSDEEIEEYRVGSITDPDLYPNNDWYDIMFSVAPMHEHYLRLSGGNELVTYSTSLGYMDQEGILMGPDAKKYSLSSNVIFNASERLKFGVSINGSYWDRNDIGYEGNVEEDVMQNLAKAIPMNPTYLPDGRYGDSWLRPPGQGLHQHPMVRTNEGINSNKTQRALINLFAEYIFPFDIGYKANLGINKYESHRHLFVPEIWSYTWKEPDVRKPTSKVPRQARRENNSNLNTTFFQTFNWSKNITDQHNVNLLLGHSMETFYNSNFFAYIEEFMDNDLSELNAGTDNKDVGGTSTESRLMSYFGRANYRFLDKYLLEVNFRYDGSSRFAKGNRWGLFPSISAGWRINEEPFMSNIDALNNLKLRFSWGQLGNQSIGLYQFASNININQGATFNNQIVPGSAVTTLSDPDITWETTTITNIGLDLGLWNNLEIIVDVFEKVTTDILARINVPAQVGNLNGPITNLYEMSNKGVEVSASHAKSIGDLRYRIGANIAFVKNNVNFLNEEVQYSNNSYGPITVIQEGHPVNSWFLYEAIGIFQSQEEIDNHASQHQKTAPGDIKYLDVNNDGKIDIKDMRVLGRSVPKYTYGFNMGFDYKRFDLSALFQGVQGIDIYPTHHVGWPLFNGGGAAKEHIENAWTPENPDAKYPRLVLYKRGFQGNSQNSTFWLQDASYLRLKNLQLGYSIPSELMNRININKLRVYLNAQNIWTLSNYKLSDPEKSILRQDMFDYPTTKIFSVGINVTF